MNTTDGKLMSKWKRNAVIFLGSQTLSLFGSSLVQYAILWYITLQSQSGIMMTIYIICGFIPTFILSPFGGVWADRYNRKFLIIVADGIIAAVTLFLAILFLSGYEAMWPLFLVSAIRALGAGIQGPAIGAILPQFIPKDKLTKVNGANGSIQAVVTLISPMVSGALYSITTIEMIFFIDVITAILAISVLILFLRIPAHEKAKEIQKISYFADMKLGLTYIKNHAFLKQLFAFLAIFFILLAPVSFLTPLQVARSFGEDVWRLTAIEMAFAIGMILGGIVIASWGGFKNKIHTIGFSLFVFGFCTFALGIVPFFWIYLLLMGIAGISMPILNTPAMTLLQDKVDGDYLGRVFGVMNMISTSMMPLGMLIFGPISDYIKIEWLLIGTGLVMFFGTIPFIRNKMLVEAGKPVSES